MLCSERKASAREPPEVDQAGAISRSRLRHKGRLGVDSALLLSGKAGLRYRVDPARRMAEEENKRCHRIRCFQALLRLTLLYAATAFPVLSGDVVAFMCVCMSCSKQLFATVIERFEQGIR